MADNTGKLRGRTIFITGASRGIGKAIALKCARDGANIVIAAKTATPHPKLKGTIYTAAREVEDAGGQCLPCVVDVQNEEDVKQAVQAAVDRFGGIDILVNNASALHRYGTIDTPMKRYDLAMNVNSRGTFLCSKYCAPHLKKGKNPHILNISPPLNMNPKWLKTNISYTMAKYGMSMCAMGMAEEFRVDGVAANTLWPHTVVYTAAIENNYGESFKSGCRDPSVMSDAAYVILTKDSRSFTGNSTLDDVVLQQAGVTDLDKYTLVPGSELLADGYIDDDKYTSGIDHSAFKSKM